MVIVPIEALPKQEFSIRLDEQRFVIAIRETAACMSVSIERDGEVILSNSRAVAGRPLIPYTYLEGNAGNFVFVTLDDELPWWENFNASQQLAYASRDEIEAFRNDV